MEIHIESLTFSENAFFFHVVGKQSIFAVLRRELIYIYLCSLNKNQIAMNAKKEGEYYSQMVRRYKNEYGGKNLQEFCISNPPYERKVISI